MFRMGVEDFEFALKHIDDIICPQKINGADRPIRFDERLKFTIRSLTTGEPL